MKLLTAPMEKNSNGGEITFSFVRTLRSFGILRKPERNGDVRTDIITAAKKAVVNGSSLIFHNSGTYTIRI